MRLNQNEETEEAGPQTRRPDTGMTARPDPVQLTEDELQELLTDAIARQGEAQRRQDVSHTLSTLDDALEIARQLNVPEEHVRAAAAEIHKRRLRERRRQLVRERRRADFLAALGLLVGVALVVAVVGASLAALIFLMLALIPVAVLGWRWLRAPVTDEEADRTELPPIPGKCRVCWRDAHTPQATFCEEHRYKGPNAGQQP
jgi:hypothetical protein